MYFEREIEGLAGITIGAPLSAAEGVIFEQLRARRVKIALEVIPPALRDEFTGIVFPDRNLKWYAQALYRNRELHSMAITGAINNHMRNSFNTGGFGQKLEQCGIRPEDVLIKMIVTI